MPQPWSRPLDVGRLADGRADVDFAVPLTELQELRALRASVAGEVHGKAHFSREQGTAVAELTVEGAATLECQRCMRPMRLPLASRVRVALVASDADAARLPADLEPVLAAGGRISIARLLTEELLLTLPIVPLHAGPEECVAAGVRGASAQLGGETHQPFARLAELLKRESNRSRS
ncbi:MAG TPA: YceD family protein [Steroidobacteraceae bacterium]|nr:YceD family protein [Steroidobacteraceae bacterium]